jgi:hypothetical protein
VLRVKATGTFSSTWISVMLADSLIDLSFYVGYYVFITYLLGLNF